MSYELLTVWVTHRFTGYHRWPDAPARRAYLAFSHRHLFHVRASIGVAHEDREVEFHDLLDLVTAYCDTLDRDDLGSCEHIAGQIAGHLRQRWPKRRIEIDVSEDGEAGATVLLMP